MEDYQKRVIAERDELSEKLHKLTGFVQQPVFSPGTNLEHSLLQEQYEIMGKYEVILNKRIKLWGLKKENN